jgi:hypothetical protein
VGDAYPDGLLTLGGGDDDCCDDDCCEEGCYDEGCC